MTTMTFLIRPLRTALLCTVTFGFAWTASAFSDEPLGRDLEGLIAHAREHNPALAASRLDAAAARERVVSATALPDPRLEIELMDVTNTMRPGRSASLLPGEVGTTTVRVSQMLPFPGKRALRGEVAGALADSAAAEVLQTGVEIESAIRRAYIAFYQVADRARILDETIVLNESLEALVLSRYGLGLASQQEVLEVQGELTSLRIEALELARSRAAAVASLNALLPRAPDAPLVEPNALPPLPPPAVLNGLIERATQQAPTLLRARSDLIAAERNSALTYRDRYPDFGVSVANNRPRGGRDSWDVMFELNIPLQQGSRRAREREAEYTRGAAEARHAAAEARLVGEIGETHAALEARRGQAGLIRHTLLPQIEAGLESARAGYETGSVGFAPVLAAQQRVLRTRLALLETEVEAALSAADLAQLLGAPL